MRFVWKQAQAKCLPRHDTAPRRPETPAEIRESPMRSRPPPSEKETARAAKAHPMEDISRQKPCPAACRRTACRTPEPRRTHGRRQNCKAEHRQISPLQKAKDSNRGVPPLCRPYHHQIPHQKEHPELFHKITPSYPLRKRIWQGQSLHAASERKNNPHNGTQHDIKNRVLFPFIRCEQQHHKQNTFLNADIAAKIGKR